MKGGNLLYDGLMLFALLGPTFLAGLSKDQAMITGFFLAVCDKHAELMLSQRTPDLAGRLRVLRQFEAEVADHVKAYHDALRKVSFWSIFSDPLKSFRERNRQFARKWELVMEYRILIGDL